MTPQVIDAAIQYSDTDQHALTGEGNNVRIESTARPGVDVGSRSLETEADVDRYFERATSAGPARLRRPDHERAFWEAELARVLPTRLVACAGAWNEATERLRRMFDCRVCKLGDRLGVGHPRER